MVTIVTRAGKGSPLTNTEVDSNFTNLRDNTVDVQTHAATSKATPVDADEFPISDSAATFGLKKLTWANLVASLKSYFDSVATTLTNKTVNLSNNTITGTLAQFNAAVSDADLVSLAGAETLTNKTITDPTIDGSKYLAAQSQLAFAIGYALDQAAMANKRVTDATSYQNQTGVASFTQSASSALIRTYATATVSLPKAYPNTDYQVIVEPVSATPALGFEGQITVQSRAVNSFVLQMSGSATACSVRWKVKHNNPEGRVHVVAPTAQ